jgi:hypothetical protein
MREIEFYQWFGLNGGAAWRAESTTPKVAPGK